MEMTPTTGLLAGLAFCIACTLTWLLASRSSRRFLLDHPSHRSLHDRPTPRGGGLAIEFPSTLVWIGFAALGIAVVSFVDDLSHVHPGVRLVVHLVVGGALVAAGLGIDALVVPGRTLPLPPAIAFVVTVLFIVWLINLYNFMDGMDGFAAGMAIFGFGTFALLGALEGHPAFSTMSLIVAAAAGGFLVFNFPPARIFMGDVGSSVLGLLAAGLSLWAAHDGIFPLWVGVLVFSPFVVDATITLLRRVARRERVWEAHKTHCYQRLVELGWGHRKTVLYEYVLMGACAVSAVLAIRLDPMQQWWLLSVWLVIYAILVVLVYRLEGRRAGDERIEAL